MSGLFDNERFDFECPKCRKKITERIGRLKRQNYTCPGCGGVFETKQLKGALDRAERQFQELARKFKRL